tara:strand:+ start:10404 stop:11150 length:747 start_codon:yes stop_codon:yes gene_type:complete
MFGGHFYHATTRKAVAIFGTLFNNLKVIRQDGSGNVLNQIKVPLAYGPKEKFLARLDATTGSDASMALKLPRIAFEITSLSLDSTQKLQKRNKVIENHATDSTKKKTLNHIVAYDIGMSLYILAKNQDDGLQIMEQILPYFQPEYTISIKPVDGFTYKQDVPITLTSVAIQDDYEGDFLTRRALVYQLDFNMKMKYFGPTIDQGVIKEINIDFNQDAGGANILEEMNITINPTTAKEDDNYTVNVSIT